MKQWANIADETSQSSGKLENGAEKSPISLIKRNGGKKSRNETSPCGELDRGQKLPIKGNVGG